MSAGMGLEGIVSKRMDAPYRSGPSKTWLKSKNPASEAVRREREEDGVRPAHGHQMHELGSIDVMRLDQTLSRVTLPAHQAVCR